MRSSLSKVSNVLLSFLRVFAWMEIKGPFSYIFGHNITSLAIRLHLVYLINIFIQLRICDSKM